jgi:hypothetical protein
MQTEIRHLDPLRSNETCVMEFKIISLYFNNSCLVYSKSIENNCNNRFANSQSIIIPCTFTLRS